MGSQTGWDQRQPKQRIWSLFPGEPAEQGHQSIKRCCPAWLLMDKTHRTGCLSLRCSKIKVRKTLQEHKAGTVKYFSDWEELARFTCCGRGQCLPDPATVITGLFFTLSPSIHFAQGHLTLLCTWMDKQTAFFWWLRQVFQPHQQLLPGVHKKPLKWTTCPQNALFSFVRFKGQEGD